MPKPTIVQALRKMHDGKMDRESTIKAVALALDLITPFDLIPGIGSVLEAATDLIWLPAANAIVEGFEKAKAKADAKKAAERA
jgi:uncharacterized membrane protein YkvA (DUF1232 family)